MSVIKVTEIFWYFETNKKCCEISIYRMKNVRFRFISVVWVHFSHESEKFRFRKSLKYFNIFWTKKAMSDLKMSCQIVFDLV